MAPKKDLPDFDDLPFIPGTKDHCAWGLWDKDGKKDVFGTLNLLTPEVVKEAYGELQSGISVSLNWRLGAVGWPGYFRKTIKHKVINFKNWPGGPHGYDDEVEFNTQSSSQWDSLCHFHHQATAMGYNGVQTSVEELTQNELGGPWDYEQKLPTLNHWHSRGGLVARAVLIDYKRYADEIGRTYDPCSQECITVDDIETVAVRQNVTLRRGDILIVRTGFTEVIDGVKPEDQEARMTPGSTGVRGDVPTARWFWNQHFAAVASDSPAFEVIPPVEGTINDLVLHQYFLSAFGMPIGELWDLKALSQTCKKLGRYSFLLTSAPLNIAGLVGSPPNALALF